MQDAQKHSSSYRDPSGFLFHQNGILYRQVNQVFKEDFDQLISGGLYDRLVEKKLLVPHKAIKENFTGEKEWYLTLQPEFIPFISYPYEWSFDMLKDAALLTLELAEEAMKSGMMLKDASAYNVQWHEGRMIFIDTLSFEKYDETKPWIAYRQFCEHFFAPLALMHYLKVPLQNLLIAYPDGIPLLLAKKMLPFKSRFHLNVFLHVHLHASISEKPGQKNNTSKPFSVQKLNNLLRSLKETIQSFSLDKRSGVWSGYYEEATQREDYVTKKKNIISEWTNTLDYKTAIDFGANEGEFSQLIAGPGKTIISTDFDHYSINHLYSYTKQKNIKNIIPLVLDLANPSPALGVNNRERFSFSERFKTDLVMALALIHHLAIGKNITFEKIAEQFLTAGKFLIVEFIPKDDDKIKLMLEQKRDVYQWYNQENFLTTFSQYYRIIESKEVGSSKRILYLMQAL